MNTLQLDNPAWARLAVGAPDKTGKIVAELLRAFYPPINSEADWHELAKPMFARVDAGLFEVAFAAFPHLIEIARSHPAADTRFRAMVMASRILTFSLGMPQDRTSVASDVLTLFDAAAETGISVLDEISRLPRQGREQTFEYLSMVAVFADKRPDVAYILSGMASNCIGCPFECCDEAIDLDDIHPFQN